jgi:hypothetical protein
MSSPANRILDTNGCPDCKKSKGELKISKVLELYKNNNLIIDFEKQYRINDCKDFRPLPFDFFIKTEESFMLLEYQGMQHNKPIKYFGGELKYRDRVKKDKIKKEYCKNNNIKLIEIPYWDFDNIEKILEDALNLRRKEV